MSKKAMIKITLKEEVLDPQGKAVLSVLKSSGYNNIKDVRVGKYIELFIDSGTENPRGSLDEEVKEISEKVLSNPLIEEFKIEIK
ncbi:MAG: phosphoribosylformylglycinamidine synthase subunit PurS [Deltaproteobacteria bacterium]|jgi:phosphoribosylformylglycinamidine synthase|nr:phosphoribosylformylglycinamidine synthase subunit PurS [Deltaproteobacteria bacterium]MCL5879718.1 phosphoribosylformylglycinamidine synthase subunit PurS [Deltaproteobacteria bacterium]MDA8304147.1 phosphoribosylformylglycinamidine synthase subunit PurS [Deltaproteobacteria bacterium]